MSTPVKGNGFVSSLIMPCIGIIGKTTIGGETIDLGSTGWKRLSRHRVITLLVVENIRCWARTMQNKILILNFWSRYACIAFKTFHECDRWVVLPSSTLILSPGVYSAHGCKNKMWRHIWMNKNNPSIQEKVSNFPTLLWYDHWFLLVPLPLKAEFSSVHYPHETGGQVPSRI